MLERVLEREREGSVDKGARKERKRWNESKRERERERELIGDLKERKRFG